MRVSARAGSAALRRSGSRVAARVRPLVARGRRRRTAVVLVVVLLVGGGGAAVAVRLLRPAPAPAAYTGPLTIRAPAGATAGDPLSVEVSGPPDGVPVTLLVVGSLGSTAAAAPVSGTRATFALASSTTRGSGTLSLIARAGSATATAATTLRPGAVVGPIQSVVGARSIVADAQDVAMLVSLPVDTWGNTIAEGSTVQVVRQRPTGEVSRTPVTVAHLLAFLDLRSGTVAGHGSAWVQVGGTTGPGAPLDEVAAPPVRFAVELTDPELAAHTPADGHSLVDVQTAVLRDAHGNVEPDGTLVTLDWTGRDGVDRGSAVTVAGVARWTLQAPDRPGSLVLTALCRGTTSAAALTIPFAAAVGTVPVATARVDADVAVTVGPVDVLAGTFVPDGTVAAVTLSDASGHQVTAAGGLVDGTVTVRLPVAGLSGPLTATATVLGATGTAAVR